MRKSSSLFSTTISRRRRRRKPPRFDCAWRRNDVDFDDPLSFSSSSESSLKSSSATSSSLSLSLCWFFHTQSVLKKMWAKKKYWCKKVQKIQKKKTAQKSCFFCFRLSLALHINPIKSSPLSSSLSRNISVEEKTIVSLLTQKLYSPFPAKRYLTDIPMSGVLL